MPIKSAKELENTENLPVVEDAKKKAATKSSVKSSKTETIKKSSTRTTKKVAKEETIETEKKLSLKTAKKTTSKPAEKTTDKKKASKTSKSSTTKNTKASTIKKSATKSTKTSTVKNSKAKNVKTKKVAKKTSDISELNPQEITASTDLTKEIEVLEYYDLPYRYNQTIVKVLAQTPTTLFIYWDISDVDRANFVKQYGEDFFNNTKPVLVIHNNTMHYSFEVEIDDFANSWYLHVNDANCEYTIELGRRAKYYNESRHVDIPNNYMYVTSSNVIDAPNDHVLFDKNLKMVYFKDVKTNIVTAKDITSISFLRNMGRIYNLFDLQSDFMKNSWINSDHWQLDLKNPSSSNPSSTFK